MTEHSENVRHRYRLTLSIEGRVRFLSHLETVDTLLSALRRSGVRLALSQGMKPKPLIKVAMPRPVGVEAWGDVVDVELDRPIDPDELAFNLAAAVPAGITLQSVRVIDDGDASAASRVAGATFRIHLRGIDTPTLEQAVAELHARDSFCIERVTPKQRRSVDVRACIGDMAVLAHDEPAIRYYARLTADGSVKPDEVVRALAQVSGCELQAGRVIREAISIAAADGDGHVAEPALVGADVPAGPPKPWGAC